jgi:hypothetical protein
LGVSLRARTVGIVVAADDVNVRIGALTAGMVPDQVQVAEPQPTETTHPDAFSEVS